MSGHGAIPPLLEVRVVCADTRTQDLVALRVPQGTTVIEAIVQSGFVADYGLELGRLTVGIFGRPAALDAPLHDGDRVEIYRPLRADPKEARRLRARLRARRARLP